MSSYREKSFWLGQSEYQGEPPLEGEVRADVAIVGGGFTGLATAYFLKQEQPGLDVALLESEVIGFGASGRNAGFSMTLFGFAMPVTEFRFGKARVAEAHRYMERAVDLVKELVEKNDIDCDYEHPGFLRVATSEKYARRIQKEIELVHELGLGGIEWIDEARLAEEVRSPLYRGAWWEPRCGLLNPAKLSRGLKRCVLERGVRVYEETPVTGLRRGPKEIAIDTPRGTVRAGKVVLATNAYSHLVPGLRRKQVPVFTHIVLTEPLSPAQLAEIGWQRRQGIEDARNLVHYYRLTADNRLLMGGSSVSIAFGKSMDHDDNAEVYAQLERDIHSTFPSLEGVKVTHRWGGPVSVPLDMTPALGFLGDRRVAYSLGCVGHGVSLTHLNGWTLADLLLERETERTSVFFVNRRTIPWPPEPFRFVLSKTIRGALDLQDRLYDPRPEPRPALGEKRARRALPENGTPS